MLLYHGTTYNAWKNICSQQKLSTTTDELSPYRNFSDFRKTTPGYVYLTDSPLEALNFASKNWITTNVDSHGIQLLVVLCVKIDKNFLQIDEDEKRMEGAEKPNSTCYQFSKNIDLKSQLEKIAFFEFKNFQSCCNFFDNDENEDKIIWTPNLEVEQQWNGDLYCMKKNKSL